MIALILSAMVFVVAAAVWADSNFTKRTLTWTGSHQGAEVKAETGMLYVATAAAKAAFGGKGGTTGFAEYPPSGEMSPTTSAGSGLGA
jgi:hypothetical protein